MMALARSLITYTTQIVAPNLGYIQTWIRMALLIQLVATIAAAYTADCPDIPLKIVGHSMGGLLWLEVLNRHPE